MAGARAARPPHLQGARAAEPLHTHTPLHPTSFPPPEKLLLTRRASHDARAPRPATMTTSLQDGLSAADRAAARDSPLAAQVDGAAQGRGDAHDPAPASRLPPADATRGWAADR